MPEVRVIKMGRLDEMFDLMTLFWVGIGVAYSAVFVIDTRVSSKRKIRAH